MNETELKELKAKLQAIAEAKGVLVNGKMTTFAKFKEIAQPHKFSNGWYKIYIGDAGWDTIGLICYPAAWEKNKQNALRECYYDLHGLLQADMLRYLEDGYFHFAQKFSIGWK